MVWVWVYVAHHSHALRLLEWHLSAKNRYWYREDHRIGQNIMCFRIVRCNVTPAVVRGWTEAPRLAR